jgi:hypothetical protein
MDKFQKILILISIVGCGVIVLAFSIITFKLSFFSGLLYLSTIGCLYLGIAWEIIKNIKE